MKNDEGNSDLDEGLTLVLGGTGKIGRRIEQRLASRAVPSRVAARSTYPSFDWNKPDSWDASFAGVTTAFVSYAPDLAIPGATDTIRAFVNRAFEFGVRRLVLLSGRGEAEAQRCEDIIRNSGMEWTIVRCSWFNQNFSEGEFLDMVQAGTIALPAGNIPEPFVDVNDIADVAVAALTEDGHTGQVYELTGPRCLTFSQVAEEISHATGRKIEYFPIKKQDFTAGLAASGTPDDMIWLLGYLFSNVLDGRNAHICDGVQRALGREPTDFVEYVRRIAATGIWDAQPGDNAEVA